MKYTILIDSGFLKRKLSSKQKPATAELVIDFSNQLQACDDLRVHSLHRIYYYDAPPFSETKKNPLSKKDINFKKNNLYQHNVQMQEKLKQEKFYAVRLGETVWRGWALRPKTLENQNKELKLEHLVPNIQQKGVDMRIGLDIASIALKNQADIICLVTGDSDFIPALKFARKEGKQVFLCTLGHSIKKELSEHADVLIPYPFSK